MDLVGGRRELTSSYIKGLHQCLTNSQDTSEAVDTQGRHFETSLLKGEWKRSPNNPTTPDGSVHEYCPPEFVQDEMDRLLAWHGEHEDQGVCPEVEAAWLHHRFTQIHPFQDGNGRVARALGGAVLLRHDYLMLVIRNQEHREGYLSKLEAGDGGDLRSLVNPFADILVADFEEAIGFIRSLRGETVVELTESIAARAKRRQEASQERADQVMAALAAVALIRLEEVGEELHRQFQKSGVNLVTDVFKDEPGKEHWWNAQIIQWARHHDYYADLRRPRRWVGLRLQLPELEKGQSRLVISLHGAGRVRDLHHGTAFLSTSLPEPDDPESSAPWDSRGISLRPFRFNTEGARIASVEDGFRSWLEETIQNGLSTWAERL